MDLHPLGRSPHTSESDHIGNVTKDEAALEVARTQSQDETYSHVKGEFGKVVVQTER